MKKFGIIFAILAITAIAWGPTAEAQAKKAKKEKKGATSAAAAPLVVDLTQVKAAKMAAGDTLGEITGTVRNRDPFAKNYDDLMILLPELPADLPSKYTRMTIKAKVFGADGAEISAGDGNAMVSVIEDVNDSKNIRGGAAEGVYKNIPIKEYNLGGFSGTLAKDKGAKVKLSKAPGGVLFQNSTNGVKFIEVTAIVFHNGDYTSE